MFGSARPEMLSVQQPLKFQPDAVAVGPDAADIIEVVGAAVMEA
jgi:hypothetical protein